MEMIMKLLDNAVVTALVFNMLVAVVRPMKGYRQATNISYGFAIAFLIVQMILIKVYNLPEDIYQKISIAFIIFAVGRARDQMNRKNEELRSSNKNGES